MTENTTDSDTLIRKAATNIKGILDNSILHTSDHRALVVYDTLNELTRIITEVYKIALPDAHFVNFNTLSKEEVIVLFDALEPRDLVVLIQSTDFRLNEFRIRIHLFQHKLKVIDHQHLYRNDPDSWETYIDALEYDKDWYHTTGRYLHTVLQETKTLTLTSNDAKLTVTGGLEIPKLNIGDYCEMENIGGTFPIGEVFTEARDLSCMNGSVYIYAFAGGDFSIMMHDPFRIDVENGLIVGWGDNTPQSFIDIVAQVQTNERAIIREIGFGLNRAITKDRYIKDITAFERILGMHLSLGEKHTVYKKAGITADKTRFHVDLFPVVDQADADTITIFKNNTYTLTTTHQ